MLCDEYTIERPFGWVFFYQSEAAVVDGERSARLVGNAPIIVSRHNGKTSMTDTAFPIEAHIEAYEALGQERYDAGEWRQYLRQRVEPLD